jgi:glycine cleavage system H protein
MRSHALTIPADLAHTSSHEWVAVDGDIATVGVTSYAATALGDIVFVRVPALGETVSAGLACGEVESTKVVRGPRHGDPRAVGSQSCGDR